MRTGLELPGQAIYLEELEQRVRHVGADLTNAFRQLPTIDEAVLCDQELVMDIRWNIAEALRLNVDYRRRLAQRLAGAPGNLQYASTHDPPSDARQSESRATPT